MKNSPSDGRNGYLKYETCLPSKSRAVYVFQTPQTFSSDALKHAYASAAYLVCQYADCLPTSRLVASKNRLAPLKVMSIPRLELMGAVLSTRLANGITDVIAVNKTVFWTDSTNVCYWVRNPSRNFKPFVANRSVKYTTLQTLHNGDMFQERSTMLTYPQEEWWHLNESKASCG